MQVNLWSFEEADHIEDNNEKLSQGEFSDETRPYRVQSVQIQALVPVQCQLS